MRYVASFHSCETLDFPERASMSFNFACKADENVKKEGTVQDMRVITRLAGGNSEDYFCPIETVVCGSCHSCDRCDSTLLKEYICSEKQNIQMNATAAPSRRAGQWKTL